MKKALSVLGILFFAGIAVARADVFNGSFEDISSVNAGDADFVSWEEGGTTPYAMHSAYMRFFALAPQDGKFFLGVYSKRPYAEDRISWVRQSLSLNKGDSLSGLAAYYSAYCQQSDNDFAFVKIYSSNTEYATLWQSSTSSLTWQSWGWTVPQAGDYLLELGVSNKAGQRDYRQYNYGFFEGIKVTTSPVPEPVSASLFLLGAGALGLRFLHNKKRDKNSKVGKIFL